ncbi:MAG: hypothetical protein LDLANPLL_00321 [Turneriella sp.]|nr:hypothetical protein [Turneriella sp.]
MQYCRFILLIEYTNDEELIEGIRLIEKSLPPYDYASRPLRYTDGKVGGFKFLSFKEIKPVSVFPKFATHIFKFALKIPAIRISPAYVSLTNVVSVSTHTIMGAILGEKNLHYKLQLAFSEKKLVPYTLTDGVFKDKRTILYLNDVWQLVRGAHR